MRKNAFTLIEILIVVVIIGILAGLGLPQFYKTKERALGNEAEANLRLIAAAERIYRMEMSPTQEYVACTCDDAAGCEAATGCNSLLKLSLTTANWTYGVTVAVGPPSTFTATASRIGSGGYLDCARRINQAGTETATADCP